MGEILSSYIKTPSKTTGAGASSETKAISSVTGNTSTSSDNATESTTISFATTSDFYYQNRGKLFDPDKGKFKTAGDFHKQMIGGVAGVVYNTLLLVSVEGKVAQIGLNVARIGTSTTSLALGSDMNVASALGVSVVATAFKPTLLSYDFAKPVVKKLTERAAISKNVVTRFAGGTLNQWSKLGKNVHDAYNHLPLNINLGKAVHGHYPFTFSSLPLPWLEASLAKNGAKYTVPGGKKNYSPYYTGEGTLNQLYLANNAYNPETPNISFIPTTKNLAILTDNTKQQIDTVEPYVPNLVPNKPVKDKTEQEKLEGFIADFDSKKSKDIWIEKLDRIFRPQLYTSYDKAKRELYAIKAGTNTIATKVVMFLIEDIVKSIQNIGKGYSGQEKLGAGLDYNEDVIQKLAAYKTDLEAAGGKFIIESNGNFKIVRPSKTEVKTLDAGQLNTLIIKQPEAGPDSGTKETEWKSKFNRTLTIQKNVPAIRQLVKNANKAAATQAYVNFKNENKELVKGKWNKDILPLFYTANPKYAPKEFNRQRGLRSGDAARDKIFQGADLKR
jgi:hypothetical protein